MKRFTDTMARRALAAALAGSLMIAGSAFAQSTPSNTGGMSSGSGMTGTQSSPALSMNQEDIRALQQALNDKGHSVGSVDGIWGPSTQNALRSFQSSQGMTASGNPDSQTLQALGIAMTPDPNKGSSQDTGTGSGAGGGSGDAGASGSGSTGSGSGSTGTGSGG